MAGLQRSAVSFRRQGSSGLVWDDKLLAELNQAVSHEQEQERQQQQQQEEEEKLDIKHELDDVKPSIRSINTTTIERSRSKGGQRGYRTGRVSPAIEPPSPKVSACGICSALGKPPKHHQKRAGKGRSR